MRSFVTEFAVLAKQTQRLIISMTPIDAWCLLAHVQLACRHPENDGPARDIAIRIARGFQQRIASADALAIVAERGWRREVDQ